MRRADRCPRNGADFSKLRMWGKYRSTASGDLERSSVKRNSQLCLKQPIFVIIAIESFDPVSPFAFQQMPLETQPLHHPVRDSTVGDFRKDSVSVVMDVCSVDTM